MHTQRFRAPTLALYFSLLAVGCSDGFSSGDAPDEGTGGAKGGSATGGTSGTSGTAGASSGGTGVAGSASGGTSGVGPAGGAAGAAAGSTGVAGSAAGGIAGTDGVAGASGGLGGSGVGGTDTGGAGAGGAGTGGAGAGGAGMGGTDSGGAGAGGTGTSGSGPGGAGAGGSGGSVDTGQPIGFATLNGGTTGGKGGQTVTATTYAELKSYAESSTTYVIMVQGTIGNGPDGGQINVKSNKTLLGVGSTAFLNGVGLNISSANNIIVRNLRISLIGVTTRTDKAGVYSSTGDEGRPQILVNGGDAIGIQGTSRNIWIDHCEIFSESPNTQTNIDLYDGLIDIKNQTGFITVSWNYLHDQHKGGLVGASDSDVYADRKITFHHNYYNNVKLRVPMYRGSIGHFFNNYVVGATDASEIRASTCVRVERNYYEALHYSIYTTSDSPGSTERIDNIEVMRTSRAYPANCTADIPYSYSSVLTTTADVKTVVPPGAGVGKI